MNNNLQILYFAHVLLEDEYEHNNMRIIRKNIRDAMNPFELPDKHFKQMFRLSKECVRNIIQSLQPHYVDRTSRIPFHNKILATLHFCASGSYQSGIGNSAWVSMSQPTISKVIYQICEMISTYLLPVWVKFPTTEQEKNLTKEGFYNKWGGRGVIGVIDGTHVDILAPPITDEQHPPFVYINRKGKHSINVMLISDSDSKILACCARYPGSVHDSAIWQMSNIKRFLRAQYNNGDTTSHLIGDSGYPLEPWLFTPFANVVRNTIQAQFNEQLSSMRNVIERTNGILKGRFRCLSKQRMLMYHPTRAANIIYTCCVLHNIAITANLPLQENDIEYREANGPEENQNGDDLHQEGRITRDQYMQQNFN